MKKFLLTLVAVTMLTASCETSVKEADVPQATRDAFNTKYPNSTVKEWEMEGNDVYEVKFTSGGKDMCAKFKPDGTFIEEED